MNKGGGKWREYRGLTQQVLRDSPDHHKLQTDEKMLDDLTVSAYFKYIFMTVSGKSTGDRVPGKVPGKK